MSAELFIAPHKGLWSVQIVKGRPSSMCRKCLTERKTARSSLSKALYLISAGLNFLEKKANGEPSEPANTAPTAVKEASVVSDKVSEGSG